MVLPLATHAEDLMTVYQQALGADPNRKAAALQAEIGSAQTGQAIGQMLPQVSASGNWSTNQKRNAQGALARNSNYPGTRYYVSLNQSLIDFAKFWNWRQASRVEDQYTTQAIEAEHELMAKVVDRYFTVLETEDQLMFLNAAKQATEKQLEQVKKRFEKQLLKITDVYEVEAQLDQVSAEGILADSQRLTANEALRELTGVRPVGLSKLQSSVAYKPVEGDVQQWIEMAISQNPGISAKAIAIDAAQNNVAVQKSKYLPVVDLQLNFYDTNTGYQSSSLGYDTQTQVAAINVNVPIFTGGVTTHQLFEAQHRLELSKNDREAGERALIKEVSDSFSGTNANVKHIQAAQKALDSAGKSREAMERGFQLGMVTTSDVLKAQQQEFLAQRDLSKAKYSYIKNRIRFMRAIGSISDENLQEVNGWLLPTM